MKSIDFLARAAAAVLLVAALPVSLARGDTSIELSVGGLTFGQNPDVTMESEEVRITPETVTVRYRLLNQGAQPVTLPVAFPLPEIDLTDPDVNYALSGNDPLNFVGYSTKVDGKPVRFDVRQQALLADKDITQTLRSAGIPLLRMGEQRASITRASQQVRDKLVADGVLREAGNDVNGQTLYNGAWMVKTSATRQQEVPPGKPVVIEHSYRTSVGISFDTILRKAVRESAAMQPEFQRYKTDYCLPDGLVRSVDRIATGVEANTVKLQERRITYVTRTEGDTLGPAKDFRLVIDKGRADRLISFCGENVKKISATAFEMRAKDFKPERDVKILIITKIDAPVPVAQPDAPLLRQSGGARQERND